MDKQRRIWLRTNPFICAFYGTVLLSHEEVMQVKESFFGAT